MWVPTSQANPPECVILLHGLARTEKSMNNLEEKLLEQGYQTVNLGYPSRDHDIPTLASKAIEPALLECGTAEVIHFVTHSLGGILVRQYLSENEIQNLKYTVMLGPPNQGSEAVDRLRAWPGFSFIGGEAGLQLGTGELSVPKSLGEAKFQVGIVAGTRSQNAVGSYLIPGKDDGKVSIESTKLEGMTDHVEVPTNHMFLLRNKTVIKQVIHFLEFGQFYRGKNQEN